MNDTLGAVQQPGKVIFRHFSILRVLYVPMTISQAHGPQSQEVTS
ncbi:hypothetical protein [Onishia taeanensis]|jgi:hypothetical protein|nr:hypothetical protein [Halomonas taeanensis]